MSEDLPVTKMIQWVANDGSLAGLLNPDMWDLDLDLLYGEWLTMEIRYKLDPKEGATISDIRLILP